MTNTIERLHRASQLLEAELEGYGLTPRQITLLQAIGRSDRPKQIELAASTGIDRSTLADMVQRLMKRGLITRRRTREDARAYCVTLTKAGEDAARDGASMLASIDEDLASAIGKRRLADLNATLDLIERHRIGTGSKAAA